MRAKPFAAVVLVPGFVLAVAGCEQGSRCMYGEVPVRLQQGAWSGQTVCVARDSVSGQRAPSSNNAPTSDAGTDDTTGADSEEPPADEPTQPAPTSSDPPATGGEGCGVVAASAGDVRVIEKAEAAPTFEASGTLGNGTYELVQASFYRTAPGPLGVNRLKASVQVTGATLVLGAQNVSSTSTEPNESFTFLLGANDVTKVCETRHGNVATWLLPVAPGQSTEARVAFDASSQTLRLLVRRNEGFTELVFAR